MRCPVQQCVFDQQKTGDRQIKYSSFIHKARTFKQILSLHPSFCYVSTHTHTHHAKEVRGDLWERTEDMEVNANTCIRLDRL